jgi:hypothetical protein
MENLGQAVSDIIDDSLSSDTADGSSGNRSVKNGNVEPSTSDSSTAGGAGVVKQELLHVENEAADNEPPRQFHGQQLDMATEFSDEDVRHFVNGMRQCLAGVLQIKVRIVVKPPTAFCHAQHMLCILTCHVP